MGPGTRIWLKGAVIAAVAALLALANQTESQEFKIPLNVSHLVYRPGDNIGELEERRGWTFGQFGWSTGNTGPARTHVLTYRAVVEPHAEPVTESYGGMGAETTRLKANGNRVSSTHPSVLSGVYAYLGQGFSVSTGMESVFTNPLYLTFAGSVQFEPRRSPLDPDLASSRSGPGRRPPSRH